LPLILALIVGRHFLLKHRDTGRFRNSTNLGMNLAYIAVRKILPVFRHIRLPASRRKVYGTNSQYKRSRFECTATHS